MIHPDVILLEYEGEKTIKVDQIRSDLEEKVFLSPFESHYKIFILDDAERMNINAQNAFLKDSRRTTYRFCNYTCYTVHKFLSSPLLSPGAR